jgi:hypothetical protein
MSDAEANIGGEARVPKAEEQSLSYNQILNEIGEFGRWQKQIFIWFVFIHIFNFFYSFLKKVVPTQISIHKCMNVCLKI